MLFAYLTLNINFFWNFGDWILKIYNSRFYDIISIVIVTNTRRTLEATLLIAVRGTLLAPVSYDAITDAAAM